MRIQSRFRCTLLYLLLVAAGTSSGNARHLVSALDEDVNGNAALSISQFYALSQSCSPHVPAHIMAAIAKTESAYHPYAVSINYPVSSARRNGFSGKVVMLRQPHGKKEAIHWARWYMAHGYTVSVGLVQVNVEMARKLHVAPMALFNPCVNLAAGAQILSEDYAAAIRDGAGLMAAYSLYNSGSISKGVENGYAGSVSRNDR